MPPTITTNLGMRLPDVGFDDDTWGGTDGLNGDLQKIDDVFHAAGNGTSVGLHVGTGKTLDAKGGTAAFTDTRFTLSNAADPTKTLTFDLSGMPTTTALVVKIEEVVTVNGVQTLINKTLTAPIIVTIQNPAGAVLTLPIGPDTIVGRNSTDTLLNKTLTAPVMTLPVLGVATGTSVAADVFTTTAANVNAQTGSYTLVNADNGKVVTMGGSGPTTLSVPAGLTAGFSCTVVQVGTGQVTIAASGAALRSRVGLKCVGQYSVAGLFWILADTYAVGGDLSA